MFGWRRRRKPIRLPFWRGLSAFFAQKRRHSELAFGFPETGAGTYWAMHWLGRFCRHIAMPIQLIGVLSATNLDVRSRY